MSVRTRGLVEMTEADLHLVMRNIQMIKTQVTGEEVRHASIAYTEVENALLRLQQLTKDPE